MIQLQQYALIYANHAH